jgi:hypothetical protein
MSEGRGMEEEKKGGREEEKKGEWKEGRKEGRKEVGSQMLGFQYRSTIKNTLNYTYMPSFRIFKLKYVFILLNNCRRFVSLQIIIVSMRPFRYRAEL